jgi:hypothetical protein
MNPLTALSLATVSVPSEFEAALLIPIVAIVGGLSIPILAIFLDYRKKKLQAQIIETAIEQGLSVEEIRDLVEQHDGETQEKKEDGKRRRHPFRSGFVLFAVGAAFYLAGNSGFGNEPFSVLNNFPFGGSFVAYLLMGLGVANLISDLLNLGRFRDKG